MKTQNKIYSTSAFFVVTVTLLIVFLIYPTFRDFREKSREILYNKEKTVFLHMQKQELDNFEQNFKNYQANLNKIEKLFIDPKNPVDFIRFLEQTSYSLNLDVDINLVKDITKEQTNTQLSYFQIYSKGDFNDILEFFEKIENGPYLLQINKLTLDAGNSDESSSMVEASFLIQVTNKQS